jgi:circadian clock protein KaiC
MLGGGPESKSATIVVGALGTGKSMVGLEFLCSGATRGEPGLYYSFDEAPSRIMQRAGALATCLEQHSKTGLIEFRWQQPLEVVLDSFAEELLAQVANHGTKRVFIDGIEGLTLSALPHERLASFLPVFLNELREIGITTILSLPTSDLFSCTPNTAFAELLESADNLLLLRNAMNGADIHREAAVLRLRNSDFEAGWRRYTISLRGIQMGDAAGGGGKP